MWPPAKPKPSVDPPVKPKPRTVDPALRDRLAALVEQLGVHETRRVTGLSRDGLLGLLAGTEVRLGTIAIAELWAERDSKPSAA